MGACKSTAHCAMGHYAYCRMKSCSACKTKWWPLIFYRLIFLLFVFLRMDFGYRWGGALSSSSRVSFLPSSFQSFTDGCDSMRITTTRKFSACSLVFYLSIPNPYLAYNKFVKVTRHLCWWFCPSPYNKQVVFFLNVVYRFQNRCFRTTHIGSSASHTYRF